MGGGSIAARERRPRGRADRGLGASLACLAISFACSREPQPPRPAESGAAEVASASVVAGDPRLRFLLEPCAQSGHWEADTTDVVALLESMTLNGQRDALRKARIELAELGPEGIAVARRMLDANWDSPVGLAHVRNAIDIAAMSAEPSARDLVLRALEHPTDRVRLLALRALRAREGPDGATATHARPEDYDRVLALMPATTPESIQDVVVLLHDVDPARAEAQYAEWMERGELQALWDLWMPRIAASRLEATARWSREHYRELPAALQPMAAAPALRAGDPAAREDFARWLADDDPNVRMQAVRAAVVAEVGELLARVLENERGCEPRMGATRYFERRADTLEGKRELLALLNDACSDVRFLALDALAKVGDPAAIERGFALLAAPERDEFDLGVRAMGATLRADEKLARRAFELLRERHDRDLERPLSERAALAQAIGTLHLDEAARWLIERSTREPGELQGTRASRWVLMQVANTGAAGVRALREQLQRETDPLRRLDLLEALASPGGDEVLDALLEVLQSERTSPWELLFAAERAIAIGSVREVAPVLERVTLRVDEPAVRVALQCLLWRSYPPPR